MKYDVVIIGGGIVGLATAYSLLKSKPSLKLLLLEKEDGLAKHQTGHNSGVIHSGLYYKPGSLKAINCIKGYHLLLDYCEQYHIDYEICGKVVVATQPEEVQQLDVLHERGLKNGLSGLISLSADALKEYEPYVNGIKGLWVPQTGIINYLEVAQSLAQVIQDLGATILLQQKVVDIITHRDHQLVVTDQTKFETQMVVSCAGLYSDQVARMVEPKLDVRIIPFRGEYYQLKAEKEYLVKNLIYPVPDPNFPFLGVHFTRMKKGGVEAGPNAVFAMSREGYRKTDVNFKELMASLSWPGFQKVALKYWDKGLGEMYRSFSKKAFTKALQKLIPEISQEDLVPHGAGVRAQASSRNGGLLDDFYMIENHSGVHVCNAPSPAATSCLAIGETVARRALSRM